LNWVLEQGIDQGWFVRPNPADILPISFAEQEQLIEAASQRPDVDPSVDDPYPTFDYPMHPVEGTGPGFIVSTQKCDAVQSIRKEPFIELVRVSISTNKAQISSAYKNSPRMAFVAEATDGAWLADLRVRGLLPKDLIRSMSGRHVVNPLDRHRLALKLGDRYSRNPLPTDLVANLQRPLIKLLEHMDNRPLARPFADWRCIRRGDKVELIAITGPSRGQTEAEDAFAELIRRMPSVLRDLIDEDASRVVLVEELPYHLVMDSASIDLDEITFGKRGKNDPEQAEPLR